MNEITVQELRKKKDGNEDFQLIDVREVHERDTADIGGECIPMGEIFASIDRIARDKPVILYCRTGNRSAAVIQQLEKQHGFGNLFNLKGGITAWSEEIDPSVPTY